MFLFWINTGISLFISQASVPLSSYTLPVFEWDTPWAPRLGIFILWVTIFLPFPTAKSERPLLSSQSTFCMEEDSTQKKMLKALDIDDIHRSALHLLLPGNLSSLAIQPTGISVHHHLQPISPALHFNSPLYWHAENAILLYNHCPHRRRKVLTINCELAAICQDFCPAPMRNVGQGW